MSRRDFIKVSAATSLGFLIGGCGNDRTPTPAPTDTPFPKETAAYTPILPTTPSPQCIDPLDLARIPQLKGEFYEAQVPDTLDLVERAKLALSAMTSCTDPKNHYAPYDNFYIERNPPIMYSTTMANGKYMEATTLLRYMTGSTQNPQVDQSWRKVFIESIGDFPWWGIDGGRLLAWLGINYRIENDPCWLSLASQAVAHLSQKMVFKDDYCFFPDERGEMPTGWEATWGGWMLQGLTRLYVNTGNAETLELAGKLARYIKDPAQIFDDQGHFLARHPSDNGPALQFHHNANALEGISAYALAAHEREFASFARSGYEWARALGSPLVGFFPEYIDDWPDPRPYIDCETCCTADMIQMAMNLTEAGEGDYWDNVDRYVRNQFAEMQLLDSRWIDEMVKSLPLTPLEPGEDGERVTERMIGSFASWASANDWHNAGQPGTTFCCIGNGARALYYVWEKMIGFDQGILNVHLLLNRASPWADINSHVPYEGQVDLVMKTACDLTIRIPEWVKPEEVKGIVDGYPRDVSFQGRYLMMGRLESGDSVTVTFPIEERTENAVIGNVPYSLVIKGNDVVSIAPPGKWYPFYQKERFRNNEVQWIKRERF